MVNEKTRNHEQPRHPEYDEDDMRGLKPEIEHCDDIRHDGGCPRLSLADESKQLLDMFNGSVG